MATKKDNDPETTAHLIRIMNGIAKGQFDTNEAYSDSVEPLGLEEVSEFLTPFRCGN